MKDIILDDSIMGKLVYEGHSWSKLDLIKYNFNGERKSIKIEINILDEKATEYELGIGDWKKDDFDDYELRKYEEYKEQVKFMYKRYIVKFEETIKLVEKIMKKDYENFIEKIPKKESMKRIGKEHYESISKDVNNIFKLIELDRVIIFDKRIEIIGTCGWYVNRDLKINLCQDGTYNITIY